MTKLTNRVITIDGRKTSMRLALQEWDALEKICNRENIKRKTLLELIEKHKDPKLGLTCSVRLFEIVYMLRYLTSNMVKNKVNDNYKEIYQTFEQIS